MANVIDPWKLEIHKYHVFWKEQFTDQFGAEKNMSLFEFHGNWLFTSFIYIMHVICIMDGTESAWGKNP